MSEREKEEGVKDKRREGESLVSESILCRQKLYPLLFLISKSTTVYPNLVAGDQG